MRSSRLARCLGLGLGGLILPGLITGARAQIPLYAQRLPEGTVYIRLANALPEAASVQTEFAGTVTLGAEGATRISPYFVAGSAGGKAVSLHVNAAGHTATATVEPKSGSFITVVLHPRADGVSAVIVTDKPEYNQIKARLTFYNATDDCPAASLAEQTGRAVFSKIPPDSVQARSINPVAATLTASCNGTKAAALPLGQLEAGGLYSVWMMHLGGGLTSFVTHDTIAPPRR